MPEDEQAKRISDRQRTVVRKSRVERMRDDGAAIDLPDTRAEYLVQMLFEVGPTLPAGMGDAPLTHGEIKAWMDTTEVMLRPFEVTTLRRLSREYIAQSQKSTDPVCPPPYASVATSDERRAAVAKKIDALFR